jgi:hypothetical protein
MVLNLLLLMVVSLQIWTIGFLTKVEKAQTKKTYFVNSTAYGPANHHRMLELIEKYWSLRHEWIDFSTNKFNGIMSLFFFLSSQFIEPEVINNFANYNPKEEKKKLKQQNHGKNPSPNFPNIGKLAVLLICGDLVNVGVVEKLTIEQMARLMFDVDKGAILGLQHLGIIRSPNPTLQEVEIGLRSCTTILRPISLQRNRS